MDRNTQVAPTIRAIFSQKELLAGIDEDEDFFDHGMSSLTVIEMQILVEEKLKIAVPTSDLMMRPTIKDWIDIYTREAMAPQSSDSGIADNAAQCEA